MGSAKIISRPGLPMGHNMLTPDKNSLYIVAYFCLRYWTGEVLFLLKMDFSMYYLSHQHPNEGLSFMWLGGLTWNCRQNSFVLCNSVWFILSIPSKIIRSFKSKTLVILPLSIWPSYPHTDSMRIELQIAHEWREGFQHKATSQQYQCLQGGDEKMTF